MIKDTIVDGFANAPHRSLYHALGLTNEEQSRPLIGIVSSFNEIVPGHVNLDKIADAVVHLQEQQQSLREQLNHIQAMYLQEKLEKISNDEKVVCIFEESLDSIAMRNFVNGAVERCEGICGAFIGNDQKGYHYILGSNTVDVRETVKKLNEQFNGKGGGKPQMVQGSLCGKREEIYDSMLRLVKGF